MPESVAMINTLEVYKSAGDELLLFEFYQAHRKRERSPVEKLCWKMFEDAIFVLEGRTQGGRINPYADRAKAKRQRQLDEDWLWIRNEEPFGFDFCAQVLDLDPDYIRRVFSERRAA